MTRQTAKDFHPQALKLFDQYVHGQLTRRGFLQRAAQFTAAGVSAEALLLALSPRFATSAGSRFRSVPAAALRGFAKSGSPACSRSALVRSNAFRGK